MTSIDVLEQGRDTTMEIIALDQDLDEGSLVLAVSTVTFGKQ